MVQTNLWCGALVALGRDLGAFKLPYAYAQKTLRAYAKDLTRLRKIVEYFGLRCRKIAGM